MQRCWWSRTARLHNRHTEAVRDARKQGVGERAGLAPTHFPVALSGRWLSPSLRDVKAVLVPELNRGQVSREVKRVNKGSCRVETLRRIDGNLITPNEILVRLTKM